MSIPINEKYKHRSNLSANSHNIFQGKDNAAYEPDTVDKAITNKSNSISRLDESGNYTNNENEEIELKNSIDQKRDKKRQRSPSTLNTSTISSSSSEDSEVTTTIIDGKRAVSLHNFGKFAEQQQRQLNLNKSRFAFTSSNPNRYFR